MNVLNCWLCCYQFPLTTSSSWPRVMTNNPTRKQGDKAESMTNCKMRCMVVQARKTARIIRQHTSTEPLRGRGQKTTQSINDAYTSTSMRIITYLTLTPTGKYSTLWPILQFHRHSIRCMLLSCRGWALCGCGCNYMSPREIHGHTLEPYAMIQEFLNLE